MGEPFALTNNDSVQLYQGWTQHFRQREGQCHLDIENGQPNGTYTAQSKLLRVPKVNKINVFGPMARAKAQ